MNQCWWADWQSTSSTVVDMVNRYFGKFDKFLK